MKSKKQKPPFSIVDLEFWGEVCVANGRDSLLISYLISWARLMEKEIERGKRVEDVAKETSQRARYASSLTGAMHNGIIGVLLKVWKYRDGLQLYVEARQRESDARVKRFLEEKT